MSEHTPGELITEGRLLRDARGNLFTAVEFRCVNLSRAVANAARLALCWNSHDKLLAACKATRKLLQHHHTGMEGKVYMQVMDAIALTEKQS